MQTLPEVLKLLMLGRILHSVGFPNRVLTRKPAVAVGGIDSTPLSSIGLPWGEKLPYRLYLTTHPIFCE